MAIPNGGVPVAAEIAHSLNADLDVVISRRIPMPLYPEFGFGAITDDGTMLLNDDLVERTGLDKERIEREAEPVRAEVKRRSLLYRGNRPCLSLHGKRGGSILCIIPLRTLMSLPELPSAHHSSRCHI